MTSERRTGAKNDAIEVLRGGAALLVFVFHCIVFLPLPSFPHGPFVVFREGWLGVDLFLVISGYVTTKSWLALQGSGRPRPDVEYWRRRAFRIFPLFWVTSALWLCFVNADVLRGADAWWQVATHVTMTHGLFPSTVFTINTVTWSLTLEGCLYVFGWLILRHVDLGRHPVRWTVVVLAFVLGYRFAVFSFVDPSVRIHVATLVFGLAEGFWFGLVLAHAQHHGRLDPARTRPAVRIAIVALALLALVLLASCGDTVRPGYWESLPRVLLVRTGLALVFAALLYVALSLPVLPRAVRWFTWFGTISYGIYLWHLGVVLRVAPWQAPAPAKFAAAFAITIALSAASYLLLERPIMRWATRRP